MRIVENVPPPPPKPPRTFNLMEVSEEELRHLFNAVGEHPSGEHGWLLHRVIALALGIDNY